MKKNIIIIAAASLLSFANAQVFAAKASAINYVTPKMQDELKEEFGGVQNVYWTKRPDNQVVATFTMNNQTVSAYFGVEGEYAYSTTSVSKGNLPLKVTLAVNKDLANKNIKSVLQMTNAEGTSYFILASDVNGKSKVYKAYTDGQIELFKAI